MDTSKEYIKMCEKAQELQWIYNNSDRNNGDILYSKHGIDVYSDCFDGGEMAGKDFILIFRQDQLIEMISGSRGVDNISSPIEYFHILYGFMKTIINKYNRWINTLEKVYLLFLMREEYCKIWNIETKEWVGL